MCVASRQQVMHTFNLTLLLDEITAECAQYHSKLSISKFNLSKHLEMHGTSTTYTNPKQGYNSLSVLVITDIGLKNDLE